MDKMAEARQRLDDIAIAKGYKERELRERKEELSVERISSGRDETKISKLTDVIAALEKEINEELPAQVAKTNEQIKKLEEAEKKAARARFEKSIKLPAWREKSKELLTTLQAAEKLNSEVSELNRNYLELKKSYDNEYYPSGVSSGFHKALETMANECQRDINGEARKLIQWPHGWPL